MIPIASPSSPHPLEQQLERELADLPPLPLVAVRLLAALGDTETSVAELGRLISMDQALAGKVLRLVNSSYYGFPRQVTTIGHAMVILGFNTVRNLVLAVSAFDKLAPGRNAPLDAVSFWEHCLGVAICAQLLAQRKHLPVKMTEEAFLGGLMHDIGKMFLCQHFPANYRAALEDAWRRKVRVSVSERQHCGTNHALVGKRIAERWNLPPSLVATIWHHHDATRCPEYFDLAALVSVSDALTRAFRIGFVGDPLPPTLEPEVATWLALDARTLQQVQEELRTRVATAREFLQVAVGG